VQDQALLRQADKVYIDATGGFIPYEFKTLLGNLIGVIDEMVRVFVYANIDSGDRARTLLDFFQFNGGMLTGLYVMNTRVFTDAQVAKWLKVAATIASRLQNKTI
jgi:hypothetical protein